VKFDWDAAKAKANLAKHGVSFEEAIEVIQHALAITVDDLRHSQIEDREKTIGPSARGRILVVVHTKRVGPVIRIISARKADRREVFDYEEEIRQRFTDE
jgi:uncharacterized DUF497 family protein